MKIKTKSKKVNKAWFADHINDPYVKLAHREGYRARAAYKLKEIDEALSLIKPGQVVVDLGAVPGAWSQYVRRQFAPKTVGAGGAAAGELNGTLIALDVLEFEPIEGVQFIQGDFREDEVLARLEAHRAIAATVHDQRGTAYLRQQIAHIGIAQTGQHRSQTRRRRGGPVGRGARGRFAD